MKSFVWCMVIGGLLAIKVHAATIEDNYGSFSVNFLNAATVNGALAGFNPTLGTLDSVTFSYTSSAVLVEGNAISSRIGIDDSTGTLLTTISFPNMAGRAQQVESGTFSVPMADLADFAGTGDVFLTLAPFTACRGSAMTPTGCSEFTDATSGEVTYAYTPTVPAASVPEPSALPIFACGLFMSALGVRWRKVRESLF